MNYRFFLCLVFYPVCLFSEMDPDSNGVELQVSGGWGWVSYEENVSIVPISSSWDAPMGSVRIEGALTQWAVDLYGELRFSASATDTEVWKDNGIPVQENDLTYAASYARFGLRFPMINSEKVRILPRLGGSVGLETYERDNFFFLREGGTLFTLDQEVNETVFSIGPSAGISAWFRFWEKGTLGVDTEFTWMTYTTAENEGFDVEIDGQGGWKWATQLSLLIDLVKENQAMGISARYEIQELDGDSLVVNESVFEWPDNTLEQISVELFWMTRF